MKGSRGPVEVRFWTKVDQNGLGGCWLWTAGTEKGYGRFNRGDRVVRSHRFAYESLVGPIPDGLQLDHLCRVRHCVNPAHLDIVTSRENTIRGLGLAALNARKTHCIYGHEFTPDNILWQSGRRGRRIPNRTCAICRRQKQSEYQRRSRAKRRAARSEA